MYSFRTLEAFPLPSAFCLPFFFSDEQSTIGPIGVPSMVMSFKSIVQYHNQGIDTDTTHRYYSKISSVLLLLICVYVCI